MKPQSAKKRGWTGKTPRKKYFKEWRKSVKETDYLKYKARQLQSNWKRRSKTASTPDIVIPTSQEIYIWLKSQYPFVCFYTGQEVADKDVGIDHKLPLSRGGTYDFSNLVVTSKTINAAKGSMTLDEFQSLIKLISSWEDKGKSLIARLRASGHIYGKG